MEKESAKLKYEERNYMQKHITQELWYKYLSKEALQIPTGPDCDKQNNMGLGSKHTFGSKELGLSNMGDLQKLDFYVPPFKFWQQ